MAPVEQSKIVIVGAGPCGIACARELIRLGHRDWLMLERSSHAGGLASSVVDPAGFTWDLGGHVVFSHFGEFDALLADAMGEEIFRHERSSYVRFDDRWVPYPFQNNLGHLPAEVTAECLDGLAAAPGGSAAMDFATWMQSVFGPGITRHFMAPYNFKVWATPASEMASHWIAERVSVVDYERALRNVRAGRDDVAWGPNNAFVFPASGGTGEIYTRIAATMDGRVRYDREVVGIDPARRRLLIAGGERHDYRALVYTGPLALLVRSLDDCPDALREAAAKLRHSGVHMVGVGYEQPLADDKSWMYFPQDHAPFYRATNFAKYSPANVPGGEVSRYCAYMTETSFSEHKPVDIYGLADSVEHGLRDAGVVCGRPPVASIHHERIEYAYPVPTLERDSALNTIQPWLMEHGIYSRGRFGSWRYEIGNMDHAVKMGVDIARRLVRGDAEELWAA